GLVGPGDRHGSAWADYDNDGDLDLSITLGAKLGHELGEKKDELYENVGGGQFVNRAGDAGGINTWGGERSMAWADFARTGYLNLLDGNLKTDMVLYKNNGDGTFADVTAQAGLGQLRWIECAFADYDNDGFPDIFCTEGVTFGGSPDALFRNNGDGTFT